jgi:redox-sensitive bicupin YhaK (pirin superfamily)
MMTVRKANERGTVDFGWLDSRHTFSFGDYYDPKHMGFRILRVINDDRVAGGGGFGTHPHRDMEIVTYMLEGSLEHRDSMGNGEVMKPGDVQRMTAGRGVTHSEVNASPDKPLRLLQIWILPEAKGLEPGYEQKSFKPNGDGLRVIVDRNGTDGALRVHQDVKLLQGVLREGKSEEYRLAPGRHAWVQVARGSVSVNGQTLEEGDGAAISNETRLDFKAVTPAEFLVFDLN